MENNTRRKTQQKRSPLGRRMLALVMALVLTLTLLPTSTILAADEESQDAAVTEVDTSTTDTDTPSGDGDQENQPAAEDTGSEDTNDNDSQESQESEPAAVDLLEEDEDDSPVEVLLQSVEGLDEDTKTIDLSTYITEDSVMEIYVGDTLYTVQQLRDKHMEIPEGSDVKVELYFETIHNIPYGYKLVYEIPEELLVQAFEDPLTVVDPNGGIVGEAQVEGTKIVLTIYDSYFNLHKHGDGTLDLQEFNIEFSGSFSDKAGQKEDSDDNVISFSGSTSHSNVSFTVPFDYKNDRAHVDVTKVGTMNTVDRTIHYVVTVTAPEDNTEVATNVKVRDTIDTGKDYLEKDKSGYYFHDPVVDNGTFDPKTGVWTIDGDMDPGTTYTLEYDMVVTQSYLSGTLTSDPVSNTAHLTYNKCGKGEAIDYQNVPGMASITKKAGSLSYDSKGNYLPYTLTVQSNSAQTNIVVKDNFEDATMIQSIEATGSYPGTVTTDGASLTWIIDKLDANESVTLTYKAYLNPKAWEGTGGDSVRKYVNNTATVAVNCDLNNLDSPTIVPCSSAGTSTEVRKTWVNKSGNTGSGNYINFTVKVNGAPTSDSVTNIYDVITDGQSTYEENGYITLTRYNSSTDSRSVDSYQVPLSQVTSNNNRRWDIDLTKVPVKDQADTKNLSGPYYYVLSYNVDASGVLEVQNSAGIGVNGVGYSKSVAVAGSAGMEWNKDWSKQQASIDYTKGIVKWKITASNTISADTEFHDFFSEELSFYHGLAWFDQDTADSILVKQYNSADGTWTTLKEGEDYTFERIERTCKLDTNTNLSEVPPFFMLETDENGNLKTSNGKYIMKTDENGEYMYYNEFSLTFTHEVKATKANYLTIEYLSKFDPTPTTSEMVAAENGDETGNPYNYSQWKIPMEGKKKEFGGGGTYIEGSNVNRDIALKKTAGTYDPATGTFYWDVELNRNSTLSGNATLEEWIPEGMTFYKAQIMSMGVLAKNNTLRKATTVNDKGEGETIEASEVTQEKLTGEDANGYSSKVLFSIKNLSAFEKIQNGQLLKNDSKSVFGKVTIRIWTKVDSDVLASLSEETTFTNKVVLTGDSLPDGGIYTTAEGTVPATGTQVFYKAQASTSAPAYVQFALNINEDSLTLADGKDLVVDDEMGDGMTLGITHKDDNNVSDYFEVYDVSGITGSVETTDSEGKLGVNVSLVQAQGTPITDQCSWEAMESAGDSEGETTTTYRFTVPDGKHVVIVYWASFTGAAGTTHDLTNTAKFYYEGKTVINDNSSWSNSLRVKTASASAYSNPYFWLQKVDQLGQPVEGAEFTLYAYDKSTGKVGDAIATGTSDSEGQIYFGHRSDNGVSLALNTIYALKETQVPKGYSNGNTDYYYIEFVKLADVDNDGYYINADKSQMSEEQVNTLLTEHQGKHPTGITVEDLTPGGTYTVTNTMGASAGYTPSVTKQINNKVISSSTQFTFTLKPASGATVYTDADCTKKLPASGTQVSINGTGEVDFSKLYFKQAGTYTFTITEDALSETAAAAGYGHDDNTYILTVVVDADESSGDLKVISSSYEIQGATTEDGATPADNAIFSNALNLEGTLNLQVKKTVKYWSQTVQAGQFSFFVTKDGEKLTDANGRELTFSTQEGGLVDISIPITQDDIGKHTYVISELVPTTGGLSGVSYTAKPVIANVTIAEGNKEVVATSIKYPNTTKENGVPLMTNEYRASGSLTLTGEKNLIMQGSGASMTVAKNQFQFVVKDGNGTQVATGSTEAGGSITFTEIKYDQMDIGQTYEYTISEVAGSELFVEYSAQPVTVEVAITDNGNGTLSITPTYSGSDPTKAVFTNNQTGVIPTGVSVDVLPFAMVVVIAGGLGALQVTRKKNNNKKTRR